MPSLGCVVKRCGIEYRARIRVRSGRNQRSDGVGMPPLGCVVKRRGIEYRARVRVRTGCKEALKRISRPYAAAM